MAREGVLIRRVEPEDAQAFAEILGGESVYSNTLQLPYPSTANWRKRLAETGENIYNLVAVVEEKVVGSITLGTQRPRRRHVGQLGMSVHQDWQSRGIGTAMMEAALDLADNWLALTRIELEVFADNERAIRLYERFGFEHEGTMRMHTFRNGRYIDTLMMARLHLP